MSNKDYDKHKTRIFVDGSQKMGYRGIKFIVKDSWSNDEVSLEDMRSRAKNINNSSRA